jgi:hypothetical protein
MSLVDQLKQLAMPQEQGASGISEQDRKQLKDLEEVEATLKEIGVTLEPKFDICLWRHASAQSRPRGERLSYRDPGTS